RGNSGRDEDTRRGGGRRRGGGAGGRGRRRLTGRRGRGGRGRGGRIGERAVVLHGRLGEGRALFRRGGGAVLHAVRRTGMDAHPAVVTGGGQVAAGAGDRQRSGDAHGLPVHEVVGRHRPIVGAPGLRSHEHFRPFDRTMTSPTLCQPRRRRSGGR